MRKIITLTLLAAMLAGPMGFADMLNSLEASRIVNELSKQRDKFCASGTFTKTIRSSSGEYCKNNIKYPGGAVLAATVCSNKNAMGEFKDPDGKAFSSSDCGKQLTALYSVSDLTKFDGIQVCSWLSELGTLFSKVKLSVCDTIKQGGRVGTAYTLPSSSGSFGSSPPIASVGDFNKNYQQQQDAKKAAEAAAAAEAKAKEQAERAEAERAEAERAEAERVKIEVEKQVKTPPAAPPPPPAAPPLPKTTPPVSGSGDLLEQIKKAAKLNPVNPENKPGKEEKIGGLLGGLQGANIKIRPDQAGCPDLTEGWVRKIFIDLSEEKLSENFEMPVSGHPGLTVFYAQVNAPQNRVITFVSGNNQECKYQASNKTVDGTPPIIFTLRKKDSGWDDK